MGIHNDQAKQGCNGNPCLTLFTNTAVTFRSMQTTPQWGARAYIVINFLAWNGTQCHNNDNNNNVCMYSASGRLTTIDLCNHRHGLLVSSKVRDSIRLRRRAYIAKLKPDIISKISANNSNLPWTGYSRCCNWWL